MSKGRGDVGRALLPVMESETGKSARPALVTPSPIDGGWKSLTWTLCGWLLLCGFSPLPAAGAARGPKGGAGLEYDKVSEYSHIRVRRQGPVRTLIFVRDNGEEAAESQVNTKKPYDLLEPYSRFMFASYLLQPKPERVLIIGLGGGAMVHFLTHYDPQVQVDVVEIDPAVVQVADKFFDCRSGGKVKIITADGFKYLETTELRYDVIYMDAFLKPAPDTDPTGVPLRMKTQQFYEQIKGKLRPEGVVVFNLNEHQSSDSDLAAVRSAFARTYVFRPVTANYVVVASSAATRLTPQTLRAAARELDSRFKATYSFQGLLKSLLP